MKKLHILLIVTISLTAFANEKPSSNNTTNTLVIQKAQQSNVNFSSNNEQYQLIADGKAVKKSTTNYSSLSSSENNTNSNQWLSSVGPYQVSIGSSDQNTQLTASATSASSNYNQIAYNPRTGNVAIITGQIVITLKSGTTAQSIASSHNINLSANYPHLNTAFFTVTTGQDIFEIIKLLKQDTGVASAEVDVIEHFAQPL